MAGVSNWLEGARDEGGLLVPGDPAKHGCDLILRSGQVEVHAGEEAGAALAWEEFDSALRPNAGRDQWRFCLWTANDGSEYSRLLTGAGTGVGLAVEGRCRTATMPVVAARQTRRNRFNRSMAKGVAVPLAPWSRVSPAVVRDGALLDTLCAVLAERPEARAHLDDPERVRRLAVDLQGDPREPVVVPTLARSATVEVLEALHREGLAHPYGGRPLPGDPKPDLDALVAALQAAGVEVPADEIAAVLQEHHVDVWPWPFQAVTV